MDIFFYVISLSIAIWVCGYMIASRIDDLIDEIKDLKKSNEIELRDIKRLLEDKL